MTRHHTIWLLPDGSGNLVWTFSLDKKDEQLSINASSALWEVIPEDFAETRSSTLKDRLEARSGTLGNAEGFPSNLIKEIRAAEAYNKVWYHFELVHIKSDPRLTALGIGTNKNMRERACRVALTCRLMFEQMYKYDNSRCMQFHSNHVFGDRVFIIRHHPNHIFGSMVFHPNHIADDEVKPKYGETNGVMSHQRAEVVREASDRFGSREMAHATARSQHRVSDVRQRDVAQTRNMTTTTLQTQICNGRAWTTAVLRLRFHRKSLQPY